MPASPGVKRAMIPMMPVLPLASSHIFIYLYIKSEITSHEIILDRVHISRSIKLSFKPQAHVLTVSTPPHPSRNDNNKRSQRHQTRSDQYVCIPNSAHQFLAGGLCANPHFCSNSSSVSLCTFTSTSPSPLLLALGSL